MGVLPSREASGSIRTLRYGSHEIGLIPLTRQFFNDDNPVLCQQFIRVRNDPNVRYCHMRAAGYWMDELPPAAYSREDLDALVDTVEESLFDTNEDFLNAGAAPVASFTVAEMHRILQREGLIDAFDPHLDVHTAAPEPASSTTTRAESNKYDIGSSDLAPGPSSTPEGRRLNASGVEITVPPAQTPVQSVEATFRTLKAELQASYREAESGTADYAAPAATFPDLFQTVMYRRFKRAIRPLPCAVVFIYVNSREEHDCFSFRGHRINVIGCFGLRTYEDQSDDTLPVLQIRKGIVKAAGDRTLERVLALAAKATVDSFTDVVLRELQRRPVSVLLKGISEEARGLLRELPSPLPPPPPQQQLTNPANREPSYDPVSVANALFFERVSKYPMLCVGLFNNYPTLKFIFDFSALAISVEEGRTGHKEKMRMCTYQRDKDERGLAFLFPGRLLAYTWLWSATHTQPPTVRDAWVQYTLNEYAQSRERRVQQWLEESPTAKVMLGNATTTQLFLQHLDHLHSEIVRARTTPTDDQRSWASTQEFSYDTKLYRIFISPICGPLLTTVKEQKGEAGKSGSLAKKSLPRLRSPPTKPIHQTGSATRGGGSGNDHNSDTSGAQVEKDRTAQRQHQRMCGMSSQNGQDAVKGPSTAAATITVSATTTVISGSASGSGSAPSLSTAAVGAATGVTHRYSHSAKVAGSHVGAGDAGSASSVSGPQPPSYSAVARGVYPVVSGMPVLPSTAQQQQQQQQQQQRALQQMYLPAGCIAVPTTPSRAPWVVPQFLPPPPSPSFSGAVAASNPAVHPPLPPPPASQQHSQQSQQRTLSPPTMASGNAAATTYILQIGSDGKQTLLPFALAASGQLNASTATGTQAVSPPYQLPGQNPTHIIPASCAPLADFPNIHQGLAQQQQQQQQQSQQLFPLAGGAGGSGVYYTPATAYPPASYIAPLQTSPQPVYQTPPTTLPTVPMAPPSSVQYPYLPPPSGAIAAATVKVGRAQLPAQEPPPPSYPTQSAHVDMHSTKAASLSHLPCDTNMSEETELYVNALRLLD